MQIEITQDEIREISKAFLILGGSDEKYAEINWEIIAKFLAKLDR
jgi:hypothetical protein